MDSKHIFNVGFNIIYNLRVPELNTFLLSDNNEQIKHDYNLTTHIKVTKSNK